MANRILASNGDGIFSANNGHLVQQSIFDGLLELLDLLNRLLMVQVVEKEIDVGCRAELLMVVFPELALRGVELLGNWKQSVDDGRSSSNDIVPLDINERRLGEDIEVLLKLLEVSHSRSRAIGAALVLGQRHDVPGLFL